MLCAMDVASVTTFLPARRYASAGTGYDPVSVTSQCSIETDMRIELGFFFAWRLLSTYPKRCYKEIQVFRKIRV